MSTVADVLRFVVIENRSMFPIETADGKVESPPNTTDLHYRLWRSTRSLMEQLERETASKTKEDLADHFDHILSKRAELIFTMVRDHAARATPLRKEELADG